VRYSWNMRLPQRLLWRIIWSRTRYCVIWNVPAFRWDHMPAIPSGPSFINVIHRQLHTLQQDYMASHPVTQRSSTHERLKKIHQYSNSLWMQEAPRAAPWLTTSLKVWPPKSPDNSSSFHLCVGIWESAVYANSTRIIKLKKITEMQ
jgi:hypothetical protein